MYEAEKHFKHLENMIESMTHEGLRLKSACKGNYWASFPMACGRGYAFHAQGQPISQGVQCLQGMGQGLWSVIAQAGAVGAIGSAASRHEHSLARADGLVAEAHCERGWLHTM